MIFEYNNQKYCYIHIPKTGGTYVEIYILKHIYGEDTINLNNWRNYIEKNHLYSDHTKNNSYHVPFNCKPLDDSYIVFSIIRDPIEVRKSAYKWVSMKLNYTKTFEKYMESDFLYLPTDNKTRLSTFGLTQNEYVKGSNALLFLYEDFENVLDYIDCIFEKKINRPSKINNYKKDIVINLDIMNKIKKVFSDDYDLINSIRIKT